MSTPDLIIFQVLGVDLSEERRMVEDIHSYACKGPPPGAEGESASIINKNTTPTIMKNPPPKRKRGRPQRFTAVDLPLIEVQNNIIQALAEKINTRSDQLEEMIRRSSEEVERMSEALSSVHRLVLDLKEDNQQLRRKMKMELQANKQDKFSRGFSLRLRGLAEDPSENLKKKVQDVCRSLVPEEENVAAAVDATHRRGRPRAVEDPPVEPRPVVVRFTSAAVRNLLWKRAKKSIFLQSHGLRLTEDLVSKSKAAGSGLWSEVEQERERDVSDPNDCEEEVPGARERNSSLDRAEPEPEQAQKDREEPETAEIQKDLNQEAGWFTVTPPPAENQEEPEPNVDQLLFQNSPAAENPDQDGNGGPTLVVCRACGKACPGSDALLAHSTDHKGGDQNICCFCGKLFVSFGALSRHHRVHTALKPFVCELCGRAFAAKRSLVDHTRVHTGERPFTCDTCGRAFVRKENMIIHRRSHSGERSYSCDVCGKAFKRIDTLGAHRRIHTGEKRFCCEKCGKRFITSSSCKIHMKSHGSARTGGKRLPGEGGAAEKRFPCNVCEKRFSYKCNMLIHMRVHTGEKPFSCPLCGRCFNQKGSLKAHIRTHSGPYSNNRGTCGRSSDASRESPQREEV